MPESQMKPEKEFVFQAISKHVLLTSVGAYLTEYLLHFLNRGIGQVHLAELTFLQALISSHMILQISFSGED